MWILLHCCNDKGDQGIIIQAADYFMNSHRSLQITRSVALQHVFLSSVAMGHVPCLRPAFEKEIY